MAIASQQRSTERSSWRRGLLKQGYSWACSGIFVSPSKSAQMRCRALAERGICLYAPQPNLLICSAS